MLDHLHGIAHCIAQHMIDDAALQPAVEEHLARVNEQQFLEKTPAFGLRPSAQVDARLRQFAAVQATPCFRRDIAAGTRLDHLAVTAF